MVEPSVGVLDAVRIDENRAYIEFCFKDGNGQEQAIQVDFEYVESLAALFQQAFVSAVLAERQGPNRSLGREYLSVPRVDIETPISVAVDVMSERVVTMFMLGTPFQASYSMSADVARMLSNDLMTACEQMGPEPPIGRLTN